MKLSRGKANIVKKAVESWREEGVISETEKTNLLSAVQVAPFDWKRLARYSFWSAIICVIISVTALVADAWVQALIEKISILIQTFFHAPDLAKCAMLAVCSACLYHLGNRMMKLRPLKIHENQAVVFLGVLTTACSVYYLGLGLDTGSGHFSILFLFACVIYGLVGLHYRSTMIWIFALLSLGSWLGTETGYMSGWGAYWLGMNYPLRFVFFGALVTAGSMPFLKLKVYESFYRPTYIMGLLYLFIALWILSIFGNYGDWDQWHEVKQYELFGWSLLFGAAALGAIYQGLRFDNGIARGFGITFLFINLYTRFFEYCWNSIHKAIFFAVLGLSFWWLGNKAEKIWNLSLSQKPALKNE
jgi:hypothetical protein